MSQDHPLDSTLSPPDSGPPSIILSPTETTASSDSVSSSAFFSSSKFVFSALGYDSEVKFLDFLRQKLNTWPRDQLGVIEYRFTDIPLEWGEFLFKAVEKSFHFRYVTSSFDSSAPLQ